METKDSIRRLREAKGMTQEQLAEALGVTRPAVTQWESGWSLPKISAIKQMAEIFGCSLGEVIDGPINSNSPGYVPVPLFGRIAAGEPLEMDACPDTVLVPAHVLAAYPDGFCLTVDGESMNNVLPNGCRAFIDPCDEVVHDGKPHAVCVNGYDATIKRVRRLENGFVLAPDSSDPTFRPKVYDYGEEGTEEITVIGEVVYYVLPFPWEF